MIAKVLSPNDVGKTGGHQAGILIPKIGEILDYFPPLDTNTRNPSVFISFKDESTERWKFRFVYYNNKFFGGTRNEYRLTHMTKFFKAKNLKEGDTIIFYMENEFFKIKHERKSPVQKDYIKLSDSWVTIKL